MNLVNGKSWSLGCLLLRTSTLAVSRLTRHLLKDEAYIRII
jgi:hypothetical protein